MFAISSSLSLTHVAAATRRRQAQRPRQCRHAAGSIRAAGCGDDSPRDTSRRDILAAPSLAAILGASEQLWIPQPAAAATAKKAAAAATPKIKAVNVAADAFTTDMAALGVPQGPLGGAVGCKDYDEFKKVIYGFVDGIKSGECPPFAKDATRGFLLREEGGQGRVMLTVLTPSSAHKDGLAFFINKGPKANPLWEAANDTWRNPDVPITATASTCRLIRGAPPKSMKGMWFGQYQFGYNDKNIDDWIAGFTSPEANAFHNSVGIPFSVAHEMDLKSPGNTYKTKAKTGIEVFHLFNSVGGAREFEKFFDPQNPAFGDKRYMGPYDQIIWKVEDDIVFKA